MIETKTLHILKNIKITFLAVKPVKLFFIEKKNAVNRIIEAILKEYYYCKNVIKKKHFNKNLVVSAEVERRFQSSNKCWICNIIY